MLHVGIIGVGNAGNQVAATAYERGVAIDVFAINCSDTDLKTLPVDIPKALIGDGRGAGKNRTTSKQYLATAIIDFIDDDDVRTFIKKQDVVFVVSSTGGGTGSGISPLLACTLAAKFPTVITIPVGIMPSINEGYSSHTNTFEYLKELYDNLKNFPYMLYDNGSFGYMKVQDMMSTINNRIIDDILVLSCYYNYITKYSSIDDRDMMNIISSPGRLVVGRTGDFKEKDVEDKSIESMILEDIRVGGQVELQKDKIVNRIGVIANINEEVASKFDAMVPEVQDLIGAPIESFQHIAITEDRKFPNNVYVVLSGLTKISDKITDIKNRIEDIEEAQRRVEDDDALKSVDIDKLNGKKVYGGNAVTGKTVNIQDIFGTFGVNIPTK